MIVNKKKLYLAMARACLSSAALAAAAALPPQTLNNAVTGQSVRPATAGRIAKALGVDVTEIIDLEEEG